MVLLTVAHQGFVSFLLTKFLDWQLLHLFRCLFRSLVKVRGWSLIPLEFHCLFIHLQLCRWSYSCLVSCFRISSKVWSWGVHQALWGRSIWRRCWLCRWLAFLLVRFSVRTWSQWLALHDSLLSLSTWWSHISVNGDGTRALMIRHISRVWTCSRLQGLLIHRWCPSHH